MSWLNTIISLPISTASKEQKQNLSSNQRMPNKQYRPWEVPNNSLPFSLSWLNPKDSIHDVHGPHKKVARNGATLHTKPSCESHWVTHPSFLMVFTGFYGLFTHFSRCFHAAFTHVSRLKMDQKVPNQDLEKEVFQILQSATKAGLFTYYFCPLILTFRPFFISIFLPKLLWDWANTVSPLSGCETICGLLKLNFCSHLKTRFFTVRFVPPQLNVAEEGLSDTYDTCIHLIHVCIYIYICIYII